MELFTQNLWKGWRLNAVLILSFSPAVIRRSLRLVFGE